jgi:hypothetical protein
MPGIPATKSAYYISKAAQALVDILRLLETLPFGLRVGQSLAAGKVHEIECPFASLSSD